MQDAEVVERSGIARLEVESLLVQVLGVSESTGASCIVFEAPIGEM